MRKNRGIYIQEMIGFFTTCLFYFQKEKKILYARVYKKIGDHFLELEDIRPIIISEHNRHKIILQIVDYDYGDLLSLRWKLY